MYGNKITKIDRITIFGVITNFSGGIINNIFYTIDMS